MENIHQIIPYISMKIVVIGAIKLLSCLKVKSNEKLINTIDYFKLLNVMGIIVFVQLGGKNL